MKKLTLGVLLALTACGPTEISLQKRGVSEAEWKKDDFECTREAYATGGGVTNQYGRTTREPNPSMYQKCMEARGYTRVK